MPRRNRSKASARSSGPRPGPSSRTATHADASLAPTSSCTRVSGGVCTSAFSIRLSSAVATSPADAEACAGGPSTSSIDRDEAAARGANRSTAARAALRRSTGSGSAAGASAAASASRSVTSRARRSASCSAACSSRCTTGSSVRRPPPPGAASGPSAACAAGARRSPTKSRCASSDRTRRSVIRLNAPATARCSSAPSIGARASRSPSAMRRAVSASFCSGRDSVPATQPGHDQAHDQRADADARPAPGGRGGSSS